MSFPFVFALATLLSAESNPQLVPDLQLRQVAAGLFPSAEPAELVIEPSALPGIVQLSLGTQVFYLSEDGRYLLAGPLYDVQNQLNLTAVRQAQVRQALLQDSSLAIPIVYPAKGAARQRVAVVTNISCTFCRQLHTQLEDYAREGIELQYIMMPTGGSAGFQQTASLLCDRDPAASVSAAMLGHSPTQQREVSDSCRLGLEQHVTLAQKLGAVSTPNLVLPNGELIQGYQSPAQLKVRLAGGQAR